MRAAILLTLCYTVLVVGITTIINDWVWWQAANNRIHCANCNSAYDPAKRSFTMFCPSE